MKQIRCALYARVSTVNHGQDPEVQVRDLRASAALRGWEIVRTYVDHGYSGSTSDRPALNELMADAQGKKFDVAMCWRFDRMARNTAHLLRMLEVFRGLSVQFVSHQENIDTTTALGQAIFTIVAAVATLERDLISERVRAGLRNAVARGRRLGRPERAVNFAEVERLRASGASWKAISLQLGVGVGTLYRAKQAMTTNNAA